MSPALKLAQSITPAELEYISLADHGQDAEQHLAALKKLIFEQDCIVTQEQYWYPYEAVELTRWKCNEGHEREFAVCNILIALSIIAGTDKSNDPESMLHTIAPEYDKLPSPLRDLVLNLLAEASAKI